MGTENLDSQNNRNYIIFNVMRWLLFGVLLVVIPPVFTIWFKVIVGYKVNMTEYIPDLMLAVLSVSCNLINSCIDSSKRIDYLLRWLLCIILGLISLACWGLFFAIYFIPQEAVPQEFYNHNAKLLLYSSSIIILVCAIVGFIIELYTAKKSKEE